ncbi:nucleotidyl transferase AbiEii/AbiGii toxin family protein [Oleomonas cavernae]|uniref:Nucleotidyl transferase AbiEii/AbiGii toxin family protein n=1 Tax=Oleomonas cavernae TaxID=2320859 RepID=A0A418WT79_9PROT|nr:nucleotidyl transferase AbiEii/AbiGii toxin family protein [Oleomonas cavernae]RJF94386.1 nucleotidyl transferase AbiEii/AbiGii toxin family protein [Oleomonas cavernae]
MSDGRIADISRWVERARPDPAAYAERQATEIVLTTIGALSDYGSRIFLKGGMLMAVVYGSLRGTADIDFSTDLEPVPGLREKLRGDLDRLLPRIAARLGYPDLVLTVQSIKEKPRPFGGANVSFPALKITVAYARRGDRSEWRIEAGQSPRVVSLDISFNESINATELVRLDDRGSTLFAYALTDLIAEKFRALLQQTERDQPRYRRQDVYDIAYLVTHFPLDDREMHSILQSFRLKCRARGITPGVHSINDPLVVARARAEWGTLAAELPKLPDFDACFKKVEALYRALPW